METINFKIYTLGCKVNQYDSSVLAKELISAGLCETDGDAALAIINTCSVTKSAIAKDRAMVVRARKENPKAKIVVCGCMPRIYSQSDVKADLICPDKDPKILSKKIIEFFFGKDVLLKTSCQTSRRQAIDRARYFIKIQDGCRQFCSYCVIPYSRGELSSREPADIIVEIKEALALGYQEIVLSGIHLGLYGVDFKNQKINLAGIMEKIISLPGDFRIRLSSIEINDVSNELMELMTKSDKICRHLHISLQSGCDKILKLMNRPYDTGYFAAKIKKLRALMPDIAISTDIIVGFPGENEDDFMATYNFAAEIKFSKIHVFSFSAHEKAPAFNFPNQVRSDLIKDRSARLRALSVKLERIYAKEISSGLAGREVAVLIESFTEQQFKGKTEFYFDLFFTKKQIINIEAKTISHKTLIGRLAKIRL